MSRVLSVVFLLSLAMPVLAQEVPNHPDSLLKRARFMSNSFVFDSALWYYNEGGRLKLAEGDSAGYYHALIESTLPMARMGKGNEAVTLLERVEKEASQVTETNVQFELYRAWAVVVETFNDFGGALALYTKAKEVYDSNEGPERLIRLYMGMGVSQAQTGQVYAAEKTWESGLSLCDSLGVNDNRRTALLSNLGLLNHATGQVEKSVEYLDESINILGTRLGTFDHPQLSIYYLNQGFSYFTLARYKKAIEFLNKARMLFQSISPEHPLVLNANLGIVNSYREIGEMESSYQLAMESLKLAQRTLPPSDPQYAEIYTSLGDYYQVQGDTAKGIAYVEKAIDILLSAGDQALPQHIGTTYLNLGDKLMRAGRLDDALEKMKKGAEITRNFTAGFGQELAGAEKVLAEIYFLKEDYETALIHIQRSLVANVNTFDEQDPFKNPRLEGISDYEELLGSLSAKAMCLEALYEQKGKETYLYAAHETIALADSALVYYIQRPDNFVDRIFTRTLAAEINSGGVSVIKKLIQLTGDMSYLELMYNIAERNKASLIVASLKENSAAGLGELPEEMQQERSVLARKIAFLESQLYEQRVLLNGQDSAAMDLFETDLFEARKQVEVLNERIREEYPNYHNFRVKLQYKTLKEIQEQQLAKNELIHHYSLTSDELILLKISRDTVELSAKAFDDEFLSYLDEFLSMIKQADQDLPRYLELSAKLSEALSISSESLAGYEQLTIIPEGVLGLLPFEALVMDANGATDNFQEVDYLLKEIPVNYANSATLLALQQTQKQSDGVRALAFAPSFTKSVAQVSQYDSIRSGLANLAWVNDEVAHLSSLFETTLYEGNEATEAEFKKEVPNYEVVHLATHGLLDDNAPMYSKLVFSPAGTDSINDGYLNTRELFAMQVPANMVVLSACNTGDGRVVSGEGILSLANGFFYAGSKSVIMTLWQANDESSASVMKGFYNHLSEGNKKGVALRNAKLEYLENSDNLRAHPYYWAHFIANGNDSPIVKSGFAWYYLVVGMVLFGIVGRALLRRRQQA